VPDPSPPEEPREPLILAVDGATVPASVALLRGQSSLYEEHQQDDARMDAWLGAAIDECFAAAAVESADLDGFAVTVGPGTFTGIRVGIATCLGLAAPHSQPVCGVQTLEALAEIGRTRDSRVAACIDARRGQVYAALYVLEEAPSLPLAPQWGPAVVDPQELAEILAGPSGAPLILGSGAAILNPGDGADAEAEPLPLAAAAGRLAARSWTPTAPGAPEWPPPEPLYLRPLDARPPRNPLLDRT